MKRGQKSSRTTSRKLVKNRLQIGDSKLTPTVKMENRAVGSQYADYNKVNKSNVGYQNFVADSNNAALKRMPQVDGGKFKREVKAKGQRAAQVYGSRGKALAASFQRDKTTGEKIKTKLSEEGGLTDKRKKNKGPSGGTRPSQRPRKRGLI